MSKVSKTARASMGQTAKVEKSTIPDSELIRLVKIDREAGLFPSTQATDALLRAYDLNVETIKRGLAEEELLRQTILDKDGELLQASRQLLLANSKVDTLNKALADLMAVAGVDATEVEAKNNVG